MTIQKKDKTKKTPRLQTNEDGKTFEFPTTMLSICSLANCCLVPKSNNLVLEPLSSDCLMSSNALSPKT